MQTLGVSPALGVHDVYSLDSPDLLAIIPRPVYALIFICPAAVYTKARQEENEALPEYNGYGESEPVIWIKQTIRHACGLMGLLHAASNGGAKQYIQTGSTLDGFLKQAVPLRPTERAQLLYDSQAVEKAHMAAAQLGDTKVPPAEDGNEFHFITFVKASDGHLWELNGGMKGPVDRGLLAEDEDGLSEHALNLGVHTFLKKAGTDLQFSLVALTPSLA